LCFLAFKLQYFQGSVPSGAALSQRFPSGALLI
jgi:hypothetical protein